MTELIIFIIFAVRRKAPTYLPSSSLMYSTPQPAFAINNAADIPKLLPFRQQNINAENHERISRLVSSTCTTPHEPLKYLC